MNVIKSDNISFNTDVIKECLKEMDYEDIDKYTFMSDCVAERLSVCNDRYLADYDSKLNVLERGIDSVSMASMFKIIRRASKVSESMYKTELTLIRLLDRGV